MTTTINAAWVQTILNDADLADEDALSGAFSKAANPFKLKAWKFG